MEKTTTNNVYYLDVLVTLQRGKTTRDRSVRMPSRNNTRASVTASKLDMDYIAKQVKNIAGTKVDKFTVKEVRTLNILSSL